MKTFSLELLAQMAAELRENGLRIILANGCFDILHAGHIEHLKAAKLLGDVLMVTVTQDAHVNKGPGRPIFPIALRLKALEALECVDYICINTPVPGEAIRLIKPQVYVKGQDYTGRKMTPELRIEQAAVEEHGGKLVFTNEPEYHSSDLLKKVVAYG